ncbi:MAG: cytochrome c biogenesis CcdA family protein [Acidimicrobiales bacterium]
MIATVVRLDPLGLLVAFGAGILSFLSPCVLPLVPGYVSMVSGLSASELAAPERHDAARVRRLLVSTALFVVGFTVVFVALGATASGLGQLLEGHRRALQVASGAVMIGVGCILGSSSLPSSLWWKLGPVGRALGVHAMAEHRFSPVAGSLGMLSAPVMGMAFGFAWTPCIGPVLGALSALAASRATLAGGILLLGAYSIGLGLPFVAAGMASGRLAGALGARSWRLGALQLVSGAVVVAFGALLVAGQLGWLAGQIQVVMREVGLGRLATS